jgi:acyl-homoserine-lactone acylase
MFGIPWNENLLRTTPDSLAEPNKAVAILLEIAAKMEKVYGAIDVPWGEVFRLKHGNIDLPANGGSSSLGIFRVVDFEPTDNNRFQSVGGDSYLAASEFSQPVKAKILTSYGNSTQPNSEQVGDRLTLFSKKQLRRVLRSRLEIEAHLSKRQRL